MWSKWFLKAVGPIVVVCPRGAKRTWKLEFKLCTGKHSTLLEKRKPTRVNGRVDIERAPVYIINYDILPGWVHFLKAIKPSLVVIDECQRIKNPQAKQTIATKYLCRDVPEKGLKGPPHVLALSGTPITNNVIDIWTTLNILRPDKWDSLFSFAFEYTEPEKVWGKWQYKGAKNLDKLNAEMNQYVMIRRRKTDVLDQLPKKSRHIVQIELKEWKKYKEARDELVHWMRTNQVFYAKAGLQGRFMNELRKRSTHLRMLVGELKLAGIIEWITDYLQDTNEKLIVFGIHHRVLKPLYQHFQKQAVLVNGETSPKNRDAAEKRFHVDKSCRLFFGNIRAAGEAWSCTCTSTTVHVELDWVPTAHSQAEDRVYGVGRGIPGWPCLAYYLLAFNTMEEGMCKLLQAKQRDIDLAMDGKVTMEGVRLFDQVMRMLYDEVPARKVKP